VRAGLALCLAWVAGCGEAEPATIHIALRSPQALDPAQIASVEVAAIHEPSSSCVTGTGSNRCSTYQSVNAATQAPGYLTQITLTPAGGSTGTFDDLPFGRTCFVAEALSSNLTSLASGCAEVSLQVEKHRVEIEVQSP